MCDRPSEDEEPVSPPGDELDFIDQTVERITDAEIEARLRSALRQDRPDGPPWRVPGSPLEHVPGVMADLLADISAQAAMAEAACVQVRRARAAVQAARREAEQIAAEAQDEADRSLIQAAQMIRVAREKAAQMISDAREEAAQIVADSLAQAGDILGSARQAARKPPGPEASSMAAVLADSNVLAAPFILWNTSREFHRVDLPSDMAGSALQELASLSLRAPVVNPAAALQELASLGLVSPAAAPDRTIVIRRLSQQLADAVRERSVMAQREMPGLRAGGQPPPDTAAAAHDSAAVGNGNVGAGLVVIYDERPPPDTAVVTSAVSSLSSLCALPFLVHDRRTVTPGEGSEAGT